MSDDLLELLVTIPLKQPKLVDRSLDEDKVDQYLKMLKKWKRDNKNYHEVEKININELIIEVIEKTQWVRFDEFYEQLIIAFDEFVTFIADKDFWIIADGNKFGSEMWVIHMLADRILALPGYKGFIRTTDSEMLEGLYEKENILVTFDDCIYSGIHLYTMFENLMVDWSLWDSHVVAVTPFFSADGVASIADATKDQGYAGFFHFGAIEIEPIFISEKACTLDDKFASSYFDMGFDSSLLYPIYFDHKVAGTSSSFPTIYLEGRIPTGPEKPRKMPIITFEANREYINTGKLLKALPDRSPIEELEEEVISLGKW